MFANSSFKMASSLFREELNGGHGSQPSRDPRFNSTVKNSAYIPKSSLYPSDSKNPEFSTELPLYNSSTSPAAELYWTSADNLELYADEMTDSPGCVVKQTQIRGSLSENEGSPIFSSEGETSEGSPISSSEGETSGVSSKESSRDYLNSQSNDHPSRSSKFSSSYEQMSEENCNVEYCEDADTDGSSSSDSEVVECYETNNSVYETGSISERNIYDEAEKDLDSQYPLTNDVQSEVEPQDFTLRWLIDQDPAKYQRITETREPTTAVQTPESLSDSEHSDCDSISYSVVRAAKRRHKRLSSCCDSDLEIKEEEDPLSGCRLKRQPYQAGYDHSGYVQQYNRPLRKFKTRVPLDSAAILQYEKERNQSLPQGCMSHFQRLAVLGTGAFGKVFLVRKTVGPDRGRYYAMKVLQKAAMARKPMAVQHNMTERYALERIRSVPFTANLHYAFQSRCCLHLVLDFVPGGEMFFHLTHHRVFQDPTARFYMAQLLIALNYLHERNIIYRDVKLENILIDRDGNLVLADFGLCKALDGTTTRAHSYCGTLEYMAPEIVSKDPLSYHTKTCDYWSAGIFLYELLIGATPFTAPSGSKRVEVITGQILRSEPQYPNSLRSVTRAFLSALLIKDPRARLGARGGLCQLQAHPYFQGLSFADVEEKRYSAPLKIRLGGEGDTRYFNKDFLKMPTEHTETEFPEQRKYLKNYSWISPEHLGVLAPKDLNQAVHNDERFFSQYSMDLFAPPLGVGSSSVVRACTHLASNQAFAVKMIPRKEEGGEEVEALIRVQGHPCVVSLHEVIRDTMYTYIVMERVHGLTLDRLLSSRVQLCERQLWSVLTQLLDALRHVRSCDLIHGDLRLENILTTNPEDDFPKIKLIDFGFARRTDTPIFDPREKFSLRYMSPETLNRAKTNSLYTIDDGFASEIWSLGVILYKLTFDQFPFATIQTRSIDQICESQFQWSFPSRSITKELRALIEGMLVLSARRRSSLEDVLASPWMTAQRYEPELEAPPKEYDSSWVDQELPLGPGHYTDSPFDRSTDADAYHGYYSTNSHDSDSNSSNYTPHGYVMSPGQSSSCGLCSSDNEEACYPGSFSLEDSPQECSSKRRLDSESFRLETNLKATKALRR